MKIYPVAFDSLGARSMATYVETADVKIMIDPAVALAPDRYSLPPHKIELDRQRELWQATKNLAQNAGVIIVTHYHHDHHNPEEIEIYQHKDVFLKHPREHINESQRSRANYFLERLEGQARSITYADGCEVRFGGTRIRFSPPCLHGGTSQRGYVIQVGIEEQGRFVFTSDVQGPMSRDAVDFIISQDPDTIVMDGPATYLVGTCYRRSDIEQCLRNSVEIIEKTRVQTIVLDHHLMRDAAWRDYLADLAARNSRVRIISAAGFRGETESTFEAQRKDFYEGKAVYVDNYG